MKTYVEIEWKPFSMPGSPEVVFMVSIMIGALDEKGNPALSNETMKPRGIKGFLFWDQERIDSGASIWDVIEYVGACHPTIVPLLLEAEQEDAKQHILQ
jgi:hypothetical protein